jgi:predicted 3-demethylubiquinone-9 3-methyltransferase (glyoxalase superfamily)
MTTTQRITPFLWFNGTAEEAMNFYVSIFKNSKVGSVSPSSVTFELDGQKFMALNGGPEFQFTPAISFFVNCETQEDIDELWNKLSAGGEKGRCGWLKDKYGLSWQIIPSVLGQLIGNKNVMKAMMQMDKLDIKKLRDAAG